MPLFFAYRYKQRQIDRVEPMLCIVSNLFDGNFRIVPVYNVCRTRGRWGSRNWAATRASISNENRVNVGQVCHTARQAAACCHWPRTPCPAAGRPGHICRIMVKTLGPPSAGLGPTVTVCGVRFRKDTFSAQPFEGTYLLVQCCFRIYIWKYFLQAHLRICIIVHGD